MITDQRDEEYELKKHFESEHEELIWTGVPGRGIIFHMIDAFLIPFSLLWGGFAIFWEIMVIASGAPLFFALFGLPFVAVGLFLIVGRFVWDARRRRHTMYALTNKRVIFRTGVRTKTISTISLIAVKEVSLKLKPDGRGTITFFTHTTGVAVTKALSGFQLFGVGGNTAFELIDDAQEVYKKINVLLKP